MPISLAAIGLFAILQASTAQPPAASTPPRPACDTPAHAAFDFWVGEWDVYPNGADRLVAHSRIERLYAGCAVRENWMPLNGTGGGSLNSLDPDSGRWHQHWVGSSPGMVDFEGGPVEGRMVLTGMWNDYGGPGQDVLVRQTYTAIDVDTVRQHGETSADHGLNWTTGYDFIYRRRSQPLP